MFWHRTKQESIYFLSVGEEILEGADADDRYPHDHYCHLHIHRNGTVFPIRLNVYLFGLYHTIKSLNEGRDYRLHTTVGLPRDSFEAKHISIIERITGNHNIPDPLNKTNVQFFTMIKEITSSEILISGELNQLLTNSSKQMQYIK